MTSARNIGGPHDTLYVLVDQVVLAGDCGVGKSCLLSRFTSDSFSMDSKATIGKLM